MKICFVTKTKSVQLFLWKSPGETRKDKYTMLYAGLIDYTAKEKVVRRSLEKSKFKLEPIQLFDVFVVKRSVQLPNSLHNEEADRGFGVLGA